jgi:hypothetical protein
MAFTIDRNSTIAALLSIVVCTASPLRAEPAEQPPLDMEGIDPSIDWSVLDFNAASLLTTLPDGKTITVVPTPRGTATNWNRTTHRDGSAAITADKPLPTIWDTKVGVDLGLAAPQSPLMTPDRLLAGSTDQSNGAAWARTTAPALNLPIGWDKASLEARFDPVQDRSKLGTRLSKSVPLGEDLSVTMESGFAVTHIRSQPLPDTLSGVQPENVFDAERLAKLNFLATGTSIGAGSRKSTADDIWLNSLSAEQKLPGGLSVTGTVSETLEGETSKSLTAGFRRSW